MADRICEGPIPIPEALRLAAQITEALEAANQRGVVHRDLKPANIKVRPDGTAKVLDFGLATLTSSLDTLEGTSALSQAPTMAGAGTTRMGTLVGTPSYMSPEQIRGQTASNKADIWAFGCVLYEMLTGQPAFDAGTLSDTIARVLEREPGVRFHLRHRPQSTSCCTSVYKRTSIIVWTMLPTRELGSMRHAGVLARAAGSSHSLSLRRE